MLASYSALALGIAALAALYPNISAAAGSAELCLLGVPQLVKNYREKEAATRDVSLESTLIWLFVAGFLTLVSWIRHSSGWYILMNAAGVAQSGVMIAQINAYARPAGALRKSSAAAGVVGLVALSALNGCLLSPASWAYVLFATAMALLIVMNVPQIVKNFALYRAEGTAPKITPVYPAVVMTGSFLHLIAALSFKDSFWAFNSAVSVAQTSVILGQIVLPEATNAGLGQLVALRRAWISTWA